MEGKAGFFRGSCYDLNLSPRADLLDVWLSRCKPASQVS